MRGLFPLFVVSLLGVFLLVIEGLAQTARSRFMVFVALFGVVLAGMSLLFAWSDSEAHELFSGMLIVNRTALVFDALFLSAAALVLLLMAGEVSVAGTGTAPALMLFSVAGMMMLAHANDLVTVFLGIETMSLPAYVLCGSAGTSQSSESALKYFVLGAFASGFLLYGIVLIYGACGSTSFPDIVAAKGKSSLFTAGMILMLIGLSFKVAAVPFHMWAPDVYEGAPTPVTAFLAAAVKAGGFAAILRVFGQLFMSDDLFYGPSGWGSILSVLAAATMVVGNVAALKQHSVKRLLAWSSVAHAGYVLVGVVASGVGAMGAPAVLYYLAAYTVTTIGAFGVCAYLGISDLSDFAGLGTSRPAVALGMTVFLLSLAGVPPTVGFFGKLLVFQAALDQSQLLWLVVLGVLMSVVGAAYYLRVLISMYLREPAGTRLLAPSIPAACALVLAVLGTLSPLLL